MRTRTILVLVILLSMLGADTARARQSEEDGAGSTRPGSRIVLLPIVFSSPDTRLALGVLPQYLFYTSSAARPSNLRADIYYTFNKQFNVLLKPSVWLRANAWQVAGTLRFRKWPTSFYGLGSESRKEDKESFTEYIAMGSVEALRQVRPGVYVGGTYSLRSGRIRDVEPGGLLDTLPIPGTGSSRVAGLGFVATFDTREHVYLPKRGALYRVQAEHFAPVLGSDRSYSRLTLDLRQYMTLKGPVTAAVQASISLSGGDVPFRVMPNVGEVIRGYATTRYVDRQRWAIQAEVRAIPIWWRLGFAVFGGVGDVADRIGDFDTSGLHYAVGAGIRVMMFARERITVRQDFAFGRGSSGDYLDLNEAF